MTCQRLIHLSLCVLLASLAAACGPAQAPAQNVEASTPALVVPDTPTMIAPGVVSTAMGEYSPTLDRSRNELYFMRRTPGLFDYTIYVSLFDGSQWLPPTVAPFSGQYRDAGPYLSPDGDALYFDSRRPAGDLGDDSISLWRVQRDSLGWSGPQLLRGPSENAQPVDRVEADEFGPAVDAEGTLYFYSFRPPYRGGARYVSRPDTYDEVTVEQGLPDPSAPTFVSYLYISPDGRTAIFDGRAEGRRDSDILYACRQADASWSTPAPLISTEDGEGGGWMTAGGDILLFSRNDRTQDPRGEAANLYMVSTASLPVPCAE